MSCAGLLALCPQLLLGALGSPVPLWTLESAGGTGSIEGNWDHCGCTGCAGGTRLSGGIGNTDAGYIGNTGVTGNTGSVGVLGPLGALESAGGTGSTRPTGEH